MRFIGEGGGLRIPGIPIFGGGTVGGGEYERNVYDTQGNPVDVPDRPGVGIVTELLEAFRQQYHGPPAQPAPTSDVPSPVPPLSQSGATPTAPAPAVPPAPPPSAEPPPGSIGSALEPDDFLPGEHPLDLFPIDDGLGQPPPPPAGLENPLFPTPPGVSGPPMQPEWPGPPVIFGPGPPRLQLDGGFPGTAVVGPLMREVLRQVVRRIVRTRPRPIRRRRRIEEPPTWPRRPRRYGEPTPAPRRAQPPRIPRQTPGEPEWTSPYPQIEVPRVPLPPPAIEVPRPLPESAPARFPAPPVPPTPGGPTWPVSVPPTLPAPQSVPGAAPGAPATPATRTSTTPRPRTTSWPLQNPGALIAGAALSLLLRDRNAAPLRFPLQWGSPSPAPTPAPSPSPFPSGVPSPFPLPGVPTVTAPLPSPLTGLNTSALPFAQTEAARDRCHCPKPKKGKRRKCRVRVGVVWKSGPRKGQDAGTRCLSFAK